ncbi:elastin-like [Saccostrea cucullata]|uniref:elastin-like n=1 Tax=Saccostrea cuccullata TaxID=36930 RepID=UPI002ECFD3AC
MNTLIVFAVLVASCFAGYDKKVVGPGLNKFGTCSYYADYGALGRQCFSDYQCPGEQKCCFAYGGLRRCQVPIEYQRNGRCPVYSSSYGSFCTTDRNCYPGQKCCASSYGGIYGDVNTCKNVYYAFNQLGGSFPYSVGNVGSYQLPSYTGNVPYSPLVYGPGVGSVVGSGLYGPGVGSVVGSGLYGPGVGSVVGSGPYGPGVGSVVGSGPYGPGVGSVVGSGLYGPGVGVVPGVSSGYYGPGVGSVYSNPVIKKNY